MFYPKQIRHYAELIIQDLDELETALDDDCHDIQARIEQTIDEMSLDVIGKE